MNHFVGNIKDLTINNTDYRRVLFTSNYSQLVLMNILPLQEIGMEVHDYHDQFIRIESGTGKAIINDIEHELIDDIAIVIPAKTKHNIINTSVSEPLKLYTIYSPPEHEDKLIENKKITEENLFKNKCMKYLMKNK